MTPEVIEEWRVVDRWWTDSPIERKYAEVCWEERRVIMWLDPEDPIWRVYHVPPHPPTKET